MFNLLEIVRQAHGGAAADNLARAFGLAPDQTWRAIEALMPAVAMGLERNAALNPFAFAQVMASGRNPMLAFFEQPSQAFTPQAQAQGDALVAQLFGSPQVSQGVIQQAAAMSGIGGPVLRQMLPILAGVVVAGLVHAAMNTDYGALFARFGEAARGAGARPAEQPRPAFPDLFTMMLPPEAKPAPPPAPPDAAETVGKLFEAGREVQEQQMKALQTIFDAFWGAPKRG